jgi:hypothetical protein
VIFSISPSKEEHLMLLEVSGLGFSSLISISRIRKRALTDKIMVMVEDMGRAVDIIKITTILISRSNKTSTKITMMKIILQLTACLIIKGDSQD